MIVMIKALEVFMGFQQHSLSCVVIYLLSEVRPTDEFIQEVRVDHCVKIVENGHWLHEDMPIHYPPGPF